MKDVTNYIDCHRDVFLEAFGIVDCLLARRVSVQVGTQILDLNLQSVLGSAVGAFECHMLKEVSRPGNGGINLGLGTSFLGVYKLANPGTVNHFCIGVDDFDPDKMADRLKAQGIQASVDRNPANRTSGGDQLYFNDPIDKTRVQLGANGYQG